MVSVSASMATAHFNKTAQNYMLNPMAMFDARVFNVPKEEVVNYFIWRQQDAVRNSMQMLGRKYFSHKQLHKKTANDINNMLYKEKDIMWTQLDTWKKRGSCVIRPHKHDIEKSPAAQIFLPPNEDNVITDVSPPSFTEDRDYIVNLLRSNESGE